jgi:hypothetical protein
MSSLQRLLTATTAWAIIWSLAALILNRPVAVQLTGFACLCWFTALGVEPT